MSKSDFDEVKINNAVHECLDRCYRTGDVLPVIAEFLEELAAANDWQRFEIGEVELAVHKVLHGVMEPVGDSRSAADAVLKHGTLHDRTSTKLGDS